jgi:hypothetical protein
LAGHNGWAEFAGSNVITASRVAIIRRREQRTPKSDINDPAIGTPAHGSQAMAPSGQNQNVYAKPRLNSAGGAGAGVTVTSTTAGWHRSHDRGAKITEPSAVLMISAPYSVVAR